MNFKEALEKAKLLPPNSREEFEKKVVEALEIIIKELPKQESGNFNSKDRENTLRKNNRQKAYLKRKNKEARENLELIEQQIKELDEKIEEYKTGYYSEKEIRKRFKDMPEQTAELSINEHRNTLKNIERTLNALINEEKKWKKYI